MKISILLCWIGFVLICLNACNSNSRSQESMISTDSVIIAAGRTVFTKDCSSCHGFTGDGIGPSLAGLTSEATPEWIVDFIRNPKLIIESGDVRASELAGKYKAIMPSFSHYTDDQVNAILAYLHTHRQNVEQTQIDDPNALRDPIPEKIPLSNLSIELAEVAQLPTVADAVPATRITKLINQPNVDKLLVLDLRGNLYQLDRDQTRVYMDLANLKANFIDNPGMASGFGSFAFHPEFSSNGLMYTTHTEPAGTAPADFGYADSIDVALQWVLSEWKTADPDGFPFSGKSRELFRIDMVTGMHGVQEITFNPLARKGDDDYGLIYIGIGDGASAESGYPFLCGKPTMIWGTVVRIDPRGNNSTNGMYGIPTSNPFATSSDSHVIKEIYAYGFRNPHRITWTKNGEMLVANIGHQMVEALYLVQPGDNCGWPHREGTFLIDPSQNMFNIYPRPADDNKLKITYPIAEYDHDEGNAIAGGFEYWGNALPALKGKYIFGDIANGRIFFVESKNLTAGRQLPINELKILVNGAPKTLKEICGKGRVDLRFGMDRFGEIYLLTKQDGRIHKIIGAKESSQ